MNKLAIATISGTTVAGGSAGAYALGAFDRSHTKPKESSPTIITKINSFKQGLKNEGCTKNLFGLNDDEKFDSNNLAKLTSPLDIKFTTNSANGCFMSFVTKEGTNVSANSFIWALRRDGEGFVAYGEIDKSKKQTNSALYLLKKDGNSWNISGKDVKTQNNGSNILPTLNSSLLILYNTENNKPQPSHPNLIYGSWGENTHSQSDITTWSSNFDSWFSHWFSDTAKQVIDKFKENINKGNWSSRQIYSSTPSSTGDK